MNITTITRSFHEATLLLELKDFNPDFSRTVAVTQLSSSEDLQRADPYFLGCRFHRFICRHSVAGRRHISRQDELMLPWAEALHRELQNIGASHLKPEVHLDAAGEIPPGICDIVAEVSRGPCAIEIKVVDELPQQPSGRHLLQVAAYADLLAFKFQTQDASATLAYVCFKSAEIRIFGYRDTRRLIAATRHLFSRKAA